MGTLAQFATNMRKRAAALNNGASQLAVKTASTILTDLVHVTPVDTSQALSNWQVELDAPVESKIGPYFPGKQGSTQGVSSDAALAAGLAVLATKKPGQPIYISNVLPYIGRLNEGSSKQAPAGFVERAILLARRSTENAKIME